MCSVFFLFFTVFGCVVLCSVSFCSVQGLDALMAQMSILSLKEPGLLFQKLVGGRETTRFFFWTLCCCAMLKSYRTGFGFSKVAQILMKYLCK